MDQRDVDVGSLICDSSVFYIVSTWVDLINRVMLHGVPCSFMGGTLSEHRCVYPYFIE